MAKGGKVLKILFIDFETSYKANLPWLEGSYVVSLSALGSDGGRYTWILNHCSLSYPFYDWIPEIKQVFSKYDMFVAHNLKFELHWLHALGIVIPFNKLLWCTMVAEYTLTGQSKDKLALDALCEKYELPKKLDTVKKYWDAGIETYDIPSEVLFEYADRDCDCLAALYWTQLAIVIEQKQRALVGLRSESLRVTEEIEWNGMRLDVPLTQQYATDYGASIDATTELLKELVYESLSIPRDVDINLGSNEHLSAILFGGGIRYKGYETVTKTRQEVYKEEVTKTLKNGSIRVYERNAKREVAYEMERKAKLEYTTKGFGFIPAEDTETAKEGYYSTDINQLFSIKVETDAQKELLQGISELAKLTKMKSTYFDGLLECQKDGIVHPTINECRTRTGRYSSKNPNSQNFPRDSTSPVKKCFITRY